MSADYVYLRVSGAAGHLVPLDPQKKATWDGKGGEENLKPHDAKTRRTAVVEA